MTFDIDVHVCLVSDQIAPNLLPAVDNNLGPKAKRVIMLVSTKMKAKAKGLAAVLKKHGIASETVEIQDAYNFNEIREKLLNILTDNEQQKLALNLTGGTKIMTIAAQSMFAMEGLPVF
ncbi:hypothetical protein AGMMS49925_12090 [Deltaproteobacteria bacterium]|nr:hypothetical protein AGMMS49925_12090 [Deltaproteobacteria bacterium]